MNAYKNKTKQQTKRKRRENEIIFLVASYQSTYLKSISARVDNIRENKIEICFFLLQKKINILISTELYLL